MMDLWVRGIVSFEDAGWDVGVDVFGGVIG